MQRLAWEQEFFPQGRCPSGVDELQIAAVITPVEFVANNGHAQVV